MWPSRLHAQQHDKRPGAKADQQGFAAGRSARLLELRRLRRVDGRRVAQLAFGLGLLQGFEDV